MCTRPVSLPFRASRANHRRRRTRERPGGCNLPAELELSTPRGRQRTAPGDMFITLGAGNVHETGTKIAADLRVLAEMQQECGDDINFRLYEPMSKHTTMGVGGEAQYWVEPNSFSQMQAVVNFFKDRNIPVHIVGRGSNLIVREGGIRGAVIHPCCGEFDKIEMRGRNIVAGAGVKLKNWQRLRHKTALPALSGWTASRLCGRKPAHERRSSRRRYVERIPLCHCT